MKLRSLLYFIVLFGVGGCASRSSTNVPPVSSTEQQAAAVTVAWTKDATIDDVAVPLLGSPYKVTLVQAKHSSLVKGKYRYVTVSFNVWNRDCSTCDDNSERPKNLSLLATSSSQSLARTAFRNFRNATGTVLSTQLANPIARALQPTHGMHVVAGSIVVDDAQSSFQAYDQNHVDRLLGKITLEDNARLLPYGFRLLASNKAAYLGKVYLAFKVPARYQLGSFDMQLVALQEGQARVTESLEEQGKGTAHARASKESAALTVLGTSPTQGNERLCVVALSHGSQPWYLVNEVTHCRAVSLSRLTVDTLRDEYDGDFSAKDLSLREAITEAPAGATIVFAPALKEKEILLQQSLGPISVDKSLVIDASAIGGITLKGTATNTLKGTQIFHLRKGKITMKALTLIDGYSDGKIDIHGQLQEFAGAIHVGAEAELELENCTLANNYSLGEGGALHNEGNVTIMGSRFFTNKSKDSGGAIVNAAMLHIESSYFYGNETARHGGAIYMHGNSETTIKNTIFAVNTALHGGAISYQQGKLKLHYNTIAYNQAHRHGAALYVATKNLNVGQSLGKLEFYGNIIAKNTFSAVNEEVDVHFEGTIQKPEKHLIGDHNLLGWVDNRNYLQPNKERGIYLNNIVGVTRRIEPRLVVLFNNAKKPKQSSSFALQPLSPALDIVEAKQSLCGTSVKKDIKGHERPLNRKCDMGAHEITSITKEVASF